MLKGKPYKDLDAKEMTLLAQLILDNNQTPEQESCKYCHAPFKPLIDAKQPITGLYNAYLTVEVYIKGNQLFVNFDSYDEGGMSTSIKIEKCPICGRKLVNEQQD